jgi:hypothetical protein
MDEEYHSPGLGSVLNNSKNRCQNFRKIFFSKKLFLYNEKENLGEYFQNMVSTKRKSSKNNNYSAQSIKPNPRLQYHTSYIYSQLELQGVL